MTRPTTSVCHLKWIILALAIVVASVQIARCDDSAATYAAILRLEAKFDAKFEELRGQSLAACGCKPNENETTPEGEKFASKRDARIGNDSPAASRDVFHFNKLADNLNSIPASSPNDNDERPNRQDGLASGGALSPEKRIILTVGQHYESLFGGALDNLNLMMKEQLAGFRLILNKLMNRLVDHLYQHNVLANQLALVKDECSLASSYSAVAANLSYSLISMADSTSNHSNIGQQPVASSPSPSPSLLVEQSTMRSSDIMTMVRLLSEQLNQLIQRSIATTTSAQAKPSGQGDKQALCRGQQPEADEQERQLRLESSVDREVKSLQRRLDEIDSVVRQSANLLAKLSYNLPPGQPLGLDRYAPAAAGKPAGRLLTTTLTYSNANGGETLPPSDQTLGGNRSRWFAGSKVPNQWRSPTELANERAAPAASAARMARPKCQAKTSLVRPTSCRQLREAGANCTGQYYVFVRGAIKHVYCEMNMDSADQGGGWTVVLRRIDKSLAESSSSSPGQGEEPAADSEPSGSSKWLDAIKRNQVDFEQDWTNYKSGFGYLDSWSEFFLGLDLLHQLIPPAAADATNELQLDLVTSNAHELHLRFESISVADETHQFRLQVGPCNSSSPNGLVSLCEPILSLNQSKFYTHDKLSAGASECPSNGTNSRLTSAGWWRPQLELARPCERPTASESTGESDTNRSRPIILTSQMGARLEQARAPIGHLHWPNWAHSHEPIRQLVLKVRPRRLAQAAPLASDPAGQH